MDNTRFMEESQAAENLFDVDFDNIFRKNRFLHETSKGSPFNILQNQVHLILLLNGIYVLDNVRVFQFFQKV